MSDSTTQLDILSTNAQQEPAANALFNASSPAMLYGRRESACSGLVWGYYGGKIVISGTITSIPVGTITLPASTANVYIEADPATGTVSQNTTAFTTGKIPLYKAVTGTSTVTSYVDERVIALAVH